MRWLKRLGRSPQARAAGAWAAGLYLRLVHRTTRWEQEMPEETRRLLAAGGPFIVAFWHGRMVAMRAAWPGEPAGLHMLISEHADGQMIAKGMQRLGFSTIAGSSRRGGVAALREMDRRLRQGAAVGITPDGPKGPRMRAKAGAIAAAARDGVPILPVSAATGRRRVLGTWDGFCLIFPFGRGLLLWGAPVTVPPKADAAAREALRQGLESELNRLTREADRRMGHVPVEPDAEAPAPHELKRARAATAKADTVEPGEAKPGGPARPRAESA